MSPLPQTVTKHRHNTQQSRVVTIILHDYLRESRIRGHREATIQMKRYVLTRLQNAVGPLLEATPEAIDAWYSQYESKAIRTRVTYGETVQTFYRWARRRGHIATDPTEFLPVPKRRRGRPRPIPADDLATALNNADREMHLWLTLGAFAGLRVGEISRLRREEIFDRDTPPTIEVINGKGGRDRTVLIGDRIVQEVREFNRGPLCELNRNILSITISGYFRDLGMSWTCHNLRHFFGTELYKASGGDIRFVQEQMGHSSPTVTAVYARYVSDTATRAMSALDSVLTAA